MKYDIETFSLTKIFGDWWGREKVLAVDDLNLKICRNEVFGLLGPNGSGKTTTLKMLLGLLYPTKGRALCLGGDSTDPKISCRIGFMPEESYLYRYLNARETLNFYGRLFGLPSKVRKMRTEALLEMVGLKAVASRHIGTYSKGMARRIGLAQALINDPDVLILDEPTTGLDPIGTRQIKDLIIELAKRGKTVLLCSHLLADVEDVCDRIAILYGGKIRSQGQVSQLLQQSDKIQFTSDLLSDSAIERIQGIIETEQKTCTVTSPMEKLETFFINTVAAARRQAAPTSGADSTTQIGDFLTAGVKPKDILDKLVSAKVSSESSRESSMEKTADSQIETPLSEPDKDMLGELTKPVQVSPPQPVVKTQPTETAIPTSDEARKNILDELAAPIDGDGNDNDIDQQGVSRGDEGDA